MRRQRDDQIMITFACTQNADVAIRMSLFKKIVAAKEQFCLRVERYNPETSRYQLREVVVAHDEKSIAKDLKTKIDFIETYLPTMRRIDVRN